MQVGRLYHRTGVKPALEEETAEGYRQRGLLRLEKGDLEGAIADLEQCLKLAPDHPWVPELRAHLEKLRLHQAGAGG